MIRSFPDFWKLNCSIRQRTRVLTVNLRCSVVKYHEHEPIPWTPLVKPNTQFSLSCLIQRDSWERSKNVCNEQKRSSSALWNHEIRIWNCILTLIFLWSIRACASGHLHASSLWNWLGPREDALLSCHLEPTIDHWERVQYTSNSEVILGPISVLLFYYGVCEKSYGVCEKYHSDHSFKSLKKEELCHAVLLEFFGTQEVSIMPQLHE